MIGDLKDDLFLLRVLHDKMWLLTISCLEAGDDALKAASLLAIFSLLDACGLPVSVEVNAVYLYSLWHSNCRSNIVVICDLYHEGFVIRF